VSENVRKHPLASFLDKLVEGSDCLEWKGAKNDKGYGQLLVDGEIVYAHRFIYERCIGPIPAYHFVCHRCDNPSCVRPQHLFAARSHENHRDMMQKGRNKYITHAGSDHGIHKLTEEQVLEIRRLYALGGRTFKSLGEEFAVGWTTIQKIVSRTTWRHI